MDKLFGEFKDISAPEWKQKIQVDLKGADYNETLIWNSPEGIDVKPFYHPDTYTHLQAKAPTKSSEWKICQSIEVDYQEKLKARILHAISNGADTIKLLNIPEHIILNELLKGIDLSATKVYFDFTVFNASLIDQLVGLKNKNNIYCNIDIIGHLARTGNWFQNLNSDHEILENFMKHSKDFGSILSIDMSLYQNAGANMVQQLAYGLAHANEYFNHFGTQIKKQLVFNVSIGTNYFFEIAKLRSLRLLYEILSDEYALNSECHIFATPSKRNKTIYDYNTNMLRTTTECMSAILGGANTISNLSYDSVYHHTNEFGDRIARNQLLILKHESYFNTVDNPSDGSYYIEELTHDLTERALSLFKDIEANGGFLKQLKEGTLQRKIKESAAKEQSLFDEAKEVLLGSNKYPNVDDKMKNDIERYPFLKHEKRKTLIEPIIEKRISATLEKERLKKEN